METIEGAPHSFEKSYPNENNLLVNEYLSTGNLGIASYKGQSGVYSNVDATVNFQGDAATFGHYYLYPSNGRDRSWKEYSGQALIKRLNIAMAIGKDSCEGRNALIKFLIGHSLTGIILIQVGYRAFVRKFSI